MYHNHGNCLFAVIVCILPRPCKIENSIGLITSAVQLFQPFMVDSPLVNPGSFKFDANDWRAIHMPWITEKVDKNISSIWYAIINPYSKHYDEAVKVLEYVAENYFDSVYGYAGDYPIIRKDISEYPEKYHTETQIFKDAYEIAKTVVYCHIVCRIFKTTSKVSNREGLLWMRL